MNSLGTDIIKLEGLYKTDDPKKVMSGRTKE